MGKERKWKVRKAWIWNGSIVTALVAAVAVFVVMLQTEKNMLTQYERDSIYVVTKEIPKGLVITEKNYEEYVTRKELDKGLVPVSALDSPEQIVGLVAVYGIEEGTLLTRGMFENFNQITADMEEPVIAGFKADDLYQVVGGVLRAGDRIHIYRVDETAIKKESAQPLEYAEETESAGVGNAELIWGNLFIQEVFNQTGAIISSEDTTTSAQRINIYMDNDNVAEFYGELAKGSLRVVKICD